MLLLLFGGANAVNQAPVVSAGADFSILTGSPAGLSGSVTDDGLPSGTLTSLWTQDSGPGTTVFNDDTDPTTIATFPTAGTYVLRLTGDDGSLTSADTVTVTVSDPAAGGSARRKWWFLLWR